MAAFIRRAAGILTISTALVVPTCYYTETSWPEWWRLGALLCEMIIAIALIWRFQSGRWRPPALTDLLLLAAHFAFWWFVPGPSPRSPGYSGPAGPILGFRARDSRVPICEDWERRDT
jgi:hypothetical protein